MVWEHAFSVPPSAGPADPWQFLQSHRSAVRWLWSEGLPRWQSATRQTQQPSTWKEMSGIFGKLH